MTMTLTYVTTGSALAHAIADSTRDDEGSAARAWVAGQLRFERLLRTLEQETEDTPTNPFSDAQ